MYILYNLRPDVYYSHPIPLRRINILPRHLSSGRTTRTRPRQINPLPLTRAGTPHTSSRTTCARGRVYARHYLRLDICLFVSLTCVFGLHVRGNNSAKKYPLIVLVTYSKCFSFVFKRIKTRRQRRKDKSEIEVALSKAIPGMAPPYRDFFRLSPRIENFSFAVAKVVDFTQARNTLRRHGIVQ